MIRVIDGDTFKIRFSNNQTARIRLHGGDTPEYDQPYGDSAAQFMQKTIARKHVILDVRDTDMYGRIVCQELLRRGLAWHYKRYDPTPYPAQLEQ